MNVLFVCENNWRSQIAEAAFNRSINNGVAAESAGIEVAVEKGESGPIHLDVAQDIGEAGYDLSKCKGRQLTEEMVEQADLIVAMVEKEKMPEYLLHSKKMIQWEIDAPKDKSVEAQRRVQNKIVRLAARLAENIKESRRTIPTPSRSHA